MTGDQGDSSDSNSDPTISGSSFAVSESAANGTTVGTATGNDSDGDTLTYSITAGNDSGLFAINSSSGEITLAAALLTPRDNAKPFATGVRLTDTGSGIRPAPCSR